MYHIVTRKRAPTEDPDEPEKKERVIHTRVPESLEAELRQKAQELGISVSNLVRNVLGHAFGLVGDVVADGHAIARAARGDKRAHAAGAPGAPAVHPAAAAAAPAPAIEDVLGWQPMVLGCVLLGSVAAFVGYVALDLLWRASIADYLARRRKRK